MTILFSKSSVKNKLKASSSNFIPLAAAAGPGVVLELFSAVLFLGGRLWLAFGELSTSTEFHTNTGILDGLGVAGSFEGPATVSLFLTVDHAIFSLFFAICLF